MKVVAVLFAVVAVAIAAPQQRSQDVNAYIVKFNSDNIGTGDYNYAYETSNGIAADEQGHLNNQNTDHESLAVRGSFRYVGDDGVTYQVTYVADENGFQPQGAHLPVA